MHWSTSASSSEFPAQCQAASSSLSHYLPPPHIFRPPLFLPCCPSSSSRRFLVVPLPFLPFLAILPLILRSSVSSYRLFGFSFLFCVLYVISNQKILD
jgi:hypothetical protein